MTPLIQDSKRRNFMKRGAALMGAAIASFQAQSQTMQPKARNTPGDRSASDAGPENTPVKDVNPSSFTPPQTDHGEVQTFWNTFSAAHRRIQEGGWSRQVTVEDFPISKDIAGVNMRLTAGGIRELHWHDAGEWAIMLSGSARITAVDNTGKGFVSDVGLNDLWYFPSGIPHSIQGLQPDGCEFLLVFDDGKFSEANTTLISDWTRHTPREVLAKNWGVQESALEPIYRQTPPDGKYIFQAAAPPPLTEDRSSATSASPVAFDFRLSKMAPTFMRTGGEVRVIDTRNFPVSTTIAAAHVVLHPGGLRELHWHQNADEWQYYIQGQGRMTVFFNGAKARTQDFNPGDVGYIPKTFGHYIENTGTTDLIFLEMFKSPRFEDLSLSEWVSHIPPELAMVHLGIDRATLASIPKSKAVILPL